MNSQKSRKILIVEDEPRVAHALREGLANEGYDTAVAATGEDGFFRASAEPFELILLDLMLPGRDGIEILRTLRKRKIETPVLVLTARDALEDRVIGLDAGADDYLVKPFAFPELLARIRVLLRRNRGAAPEPVTHIQVADLEMDLLSRKVKRAEHDLELTVREFALLEYLARNQKQIVSREMIAKEVWQEPSRATSLDNVIDVHIARLRKKIDQDFSLRLIKTVRGLGFMLSDSNE